MLGSKSSWKGGKGDISGCDVYYNLWKGDYEGSKALEHPSLTMSG